MVACRAVASWACAAGAEAAVAARRTRRAAAARRRAPCPEDRAGPFADTALVWEEEPPPRRGGGVSGGDGGSDCSRAQGAVMASALGARRSALGARRSALGARRSALGARRSALGARRSALGARRSALGARRSALGARRSALGARRSALLVRQTASNHCAQCEPIVGPPLAPARSDNALPPAKFRARARFAPARSPVHESLHCGRCGGIRTGDARACQDYFLLTYWI